MTRTLDPAIMVTIETRHDIADAALQEWDKTNSDRKKPDYGISRSAVLVGVDGMPLEYGGLDREKFFRDLSRDAPHIDPELEELGIETKKPAGGYNLSEYG